MGWGWGMAAGPPCACVEGMGRVTQQARAKAPPRKGRMKGSWGPAGARKRSLAGLMTREGRPKEIPREMEGV